MSRVAFVFDSRTFARADVRWTIATIAPLLDAPWRAVVAGGPLGPDDVPVWVGARAAAPAVAAVVIDVNEWTRWMPAEVALAQFDRTPLPCLHGLCPPPADPRELPAPWLRALFWMLAREEESLDPRRDQWECFSGYYSRLHELNVLAEPLVNRHAAVLRARLDAWCAAHGRTLERRPRWKNGAPFAAVLSHDVDDVSFHSLAQALRLLALARSPRSYALRGGLVAVQRALANRGRDPYWNFERWVEAESRHGFRSTWYFCAPPSRRHEYDALYTLDDALEFEQRRTTVAGLIKALAGRGHEIGLHGSPLSHRTADELTQQKRRIEAALGAPSDGIRQHFLRFDPAATWDAQERAGFATDSTLGYNETPGFRAGVAAPFHPWNEGKRAPRALLEIPLTCMDGALFRSLRLAPAAAAAAVRAHLETVERAGGLAGLLWHPNAAAEALYPGWWACYGAALEQLTARGAWVAPAREIAAHWREREAALALAG
jgi:peptidoglycan/xylan/chitin deacetylase (PgdA/CDA1 family)